MPGLSIGAYIAWQYAAGEAAEAGHPYIEARHLFLGILSLEKALRDREGPELRWNEREELRVEADVVEQILSRLGVEAASLRRNVREKIGHGQPHPRRRNRPPEPEVPGALRSDPVACRTGEASDRRPSTRDHLGRLSRWREPPADGGRYRPNRAWRDRPLPHPVRRGEVDQADAEADEGAWRTGQSTQREVGKWPRAG